MDLKAKKISSETLFKLVFHILLWTIWIGLPFISADDDKSLVFAKAIIPATLTNIPLFLLNSEWLIPKVFERKGMATYLMSLLGMVVVFAILRSYVKELTFPPEMLHRHNDIFWAIVPALFTSGISTAYGFITLQLKQEQVRQLEKEERLKSELSFLRSQISPHFLFNVLNSIVYLIRSKSNQAESVTIKLSELMRYLLYESSDSQVPLQKEVEYMRNYVELQKIRFEEDVDIRLNIEGDLGSQLIEPMLLIPFVENAFKHGVGLVTSPVIDISLKSEHDTFFFTVMNKTTNDPAEDKDSASGIGLRNVQRRLELLYPEKHQLRIEQFNEWFKVELSLKTNN